MRSPLTAQQIHTCLDGARIVKITPESEDITGFTKIEIFLEDGKRLEFSGWPKLLLASSSYENKTWREALEQPIKRFEFSTGTNKSGSTHITTHIFTFEDGHSVVFRWTFTSARERYTSIFLNDYRFYDD